MIGHELAVEQLEAAGPQARYQPGQCDFRGIPAAGEHAFTEEGSAQAYAVEAPGEFTVLPALYRMCMSLPVQLEVGFLDLGVDPGLLAGRAGTHNLVESAVARYLEPV